jgi:hypothetical protein
MKKTKPARPELVLVISDLHVGSTVGLLPPNYQTIEGNVIELNAVQRFLWEAWQDMNEWVARETAGSNYAVVINGDLIEGDHHGTKQIWSKDTSDHVAAAAEVLQPVLSRASSFFIVQGTESHTNNHEISLGKILRAEKNPDTGLPAFTRLHLSVRGCLCAFRHHIGTSVRSWTNATQLAAVLAEETIQAVNNGEAPPQVVCAAHRHKFGTYSNGRGAVIVSPPWQLLTRFGHKVVPEARTQPGAYLLDWRGLPDGSLPRVHERLYAAPKQSTVTL